MREEADPQLRNSVTEKLGQQHRLIILHPDIMTGSGNLAYFLTEGLICLLVRLSETYDLDVRSLVLAFAMA